MLSYRLSDFTQDHLDQATMLSQAEHWPHRRDDWEMLLGLSDGRVALSGDAVVGTALRTDYGCDVSMMNMIIVAHSSRGQGLGRKMMDACMAQAADRELRLVATRIGVPLYEKMGFVADGEISQCQGNIIAISDPNTQVVPALADDIDEIIEFDSQYFAADRGALLRWLAGHSTLAVTRSDHGELTGYAALRRFGRGQVIGPIFAEDVVLAQDLIRHFASPLEGAFVRVDTDAALGLEPWLKRIGLNHTGGGIKMRKNATSRPRPAFGFCSQALG